MAAATDMTHTGSPSGAPRASSGGRPRRSPARGSHKRRSPPSARATRRARREAARPCHKPLRQRGSIRRGTARTRGGRPTSRPARKRRDRRREEARSRREAQPLGDHRLRRTTSSAGYAPEAGRARSRGRGAPRSSAGRPTRQSIARRRSASTRGEERLQCEGRKRLSRGVDRGLSARPASRRSPAAG